MTTPNQLRFSLLITGDNKSAKEATRETKEGLEQAATAADQASQALDKHSAALDREAAAAKKTADALRDQAQAEKEVRDQASKPTPSAPSTTRPNPAAPSSPSGGSTPPRQPGGQPRSPQSGPGEQTPADLERLKVAYLPLYAAQRDYEKALADIQELQKANVISADDSTVALAKAKKSYDQQAESATRAASAVLGHNNAIKLSSNELKQLAFQTNDTVQSLALGMPPLQVFLQQGPQAVQAVGGVSNAVKLLGSVFTVTNVAIGGTIGAVAVAGAAWNSYLNSIKPVETAAAGLGRAVAGSAGSMEAAAQAGAATANITVKSARSMEAQFLSTGKIGSENFERLIANSSDFAATIGITADQAGPALAEMFSDPAKAAQVLYRQYGLIDGATADYATRLANQNKLSEAQSVLLDALPGRLAHATEATTALGRAWNTVASGASNAYDWLGRVTDRQFSGPSLDEQVEESRKRLEEEKRTRDRTANSLATRIGRAFTGRPDYNPAQADVDAAQKDFDRRSAELQERNRKAEQDRLDAEKRAAGATATGIAAQSPANSNRLQTQQLQDQIAALEKGASAPGLSLDQQRQINDALVAKRAALDGLINKQATLTQIDRLDIQIQNERNPVTRADLTQRRERLQLTLQEVNAGEAAAQAERARNQVIEETIGSNAAQASDMRAEIDIRNRLNAQVAAGTITTDDAQRALQEELQLRPLIIAAATAEGDAKVRLNKVLADLRSGYAGLAAAEKEASANDYLRSQDEQLEKLRLQQRLIGENSTVQAKANALLDAEQKIRTLGINSDSDQAQKIRAKASAVADLNTQIKKQSDAWGEVQKTSEGAIDSAVEGLANGKFGDALDSISKDIQKTALTLAVSNPLKNSLLGTDYGTISDVGGIGGIASRLFGGKKDDPASMVASAMGGKSVAAMTVTAGTVMVNGGVSGGVSSLLGGGAAAANSNMAVGDIGKYAAAIRSVESAGSGGYNALGPLTKSGDRAYGAYQVMGANIPSWTKETLGQSLSPSQFLADPKAQDSVFNRFFGKSLAKYGNANDAASVWFTGRPQSQGAGAADILGTTGSGYVAKFNTALGKLGDTTAATTQNLVGFGTGLGQIGQSLTGLFPAAPSASGSSSGGLFGWISNLFTPSSSSILAGSAQARAAVASGNGGLFAAGGVANQPSIFAEAGPEAAIPLPDGRSVPVTLSVNQAVPRNYGGNASAGGGDVKIETHNYSSASVRTEQSTDQRGGRQIRFIIADQAGDAMTTKGGGAQRALAQQYGVKTVGVRR